MKNAERTRFSGRAVGHELRADLGGDSHVAACAVVRDLPQVFYYAGVSVDAFGEHGLDALAAAPGERWIVIEDDESHHELKRLTRIAPGRFLKKIALQLADDTLYLIRLAPPPPPASDGVGLHRVPSPGAPGDG